MTAMARFVPPRPAQLLGERIAVQAGGIGAPDHLPQEVLPGPRGLTPALHVGAREFAPVVEEFGVFGLERRDFAHDERVDLEQQALGIVRNSLNSSRV